MFLGLGILNRSSRKQKLVSKSSTEAEFIGVSDYVNYSIWLKYFIEAQGYKVKRNNLYQDNQSAMRLEKNGKKSASNKTRHINIRHFFVQDRIEKGELDLVFCPTNEMLADFFTKPLQGAKFRKFRDVIMGYASLNSLHSKAA